MAISPRFFSTPLPIPTAFLSHAARLGELNAVTAADGVLTWRELELASRQVAIGLRQAGVGPGSVVALVLPRERLLPVAVLGVLRAGAAFLPVEPAYPAERRRFMLTDSGAARVLTDSAHAELANEAPCPVELLSLDSPQPASSVWEERSPDPASAAYWIYTSGSTGTPKAVMVPHRAIAHSIDWLVRQFPLQPGDGVLQKAPISFDFCVWELFLPLCGGGRLVLAKPGGQQDPVYLAELMRQERVVWALFVPSLLNLFLNETTAAPQPTLRDVVLCGEICTLALVRRFYSRFRSHLHNCYGPAEAAMAVTHYPISPEEKADPVPIGPPFPGLHLEVLDESLHPCGAGEEGELLICGPQVATGYHARPELTAERFIPDVFGGEPGAQAYRTGDRARRLADGGFVCLGRLDGQVKIRGFRIEPGEIEAVLATHPAVSQAAVIPHIVPGGETRLVAYLLPTAGEPESLPDTVALRHFLEGRLPDYMVPARFVPMSAFPLNPSGKLDRKALPPPSKERPSGATELVPPRTPLEAALCEFWAEELQLETFGIDDPFFEFGADSLGMVRLHTRLESLVNPVPDIPMLFGFPTVRALAAHCEKAGEQAATGLEERVDRRRELHLRRRGRAAVN